MKMDKEEFERKWEEIINRYQRVLLVTKDSTYIADKYDLISNRVHITYKGAISGDIALGDIKKVY